MIFNQIFKQNFWLKIKKTQYWYWQVAPPVEWNGKKLGKWKMGVSRKSENLIKNQKFFPEKTRDRCVFRTVFHCMACSNKNSINPVKIGYFTATPYTYAESSEMQWHYSRYFSPCTFRLLCSRSEKQNKPYPMIP